jgi:hypothetical protein
MNPDEHAVLLAMSRGDDTGHADGRTDELRGSMVTRYGPDDVNRVFGCVARAFGMRLVCLWDHHDGNRFGGNSQFYAEREDGRLHELVGGLRECLNGSPDATYTPISPGPPTGWLGDPADVSIDYVHDDGFHNYAAQDTAPLAHRRATTRFYLRRNRLDMLRDRPWVVMDDVTGRVAQLDDGLRLAYLATRQEAVAFRERRNEQHRSGRGPLHIDWDSDEYGAAQAMHLYVVHAEEAAAAIADVLGKAGFPGQRAV